jgi:hypothetical protein
MSVNNDNNTRLTSSVTDRTAVAGTKPVPKPAIAQPAQPQQLVGRVEQLTQSQPAVQAPKAEATKEESKKGFDLSIAFCVQNLLKDTSRSTLDKLKSLLPIPPSLTAIIDMFLCKKTKADVKVGIEKETLTFATTLNLPGLGISSSTVTLNVPLNAQAEDKVTDFPPSISDLLGQALNPLLSEDLKMDEIIKLLSTVPSQNLSFSWKNGSVSIHITLPNGASLVLKISLPISEKLTKTPDILRIFLKSILKENYAGIETLLGQDMSIKWDGSKSRFDIEFPQQIALHINEISQLGVMGGFMGFIAKFIAKNSTVIIPKNIRGTVDFKNSTIQFDKGTTFITMGVPFPNVTIKKISFDPKDNEIDEITFDELLVPNYKRKPAPKNVIDTKKVAAIVVEKKEAAVVPEKKVIVNYEFISIDISPAQPSATTNVVQTKAEIERASLISKIKIKIAQLPAPVQPQPKAGEAPKTVSVFESLKKMIKIPDALAPLIGIFFADQTKVDLNVGIEDNLTISVDNLNIPKLGLVGKASLKIPTTPTQEKDPVTLPREMEKIIDTLAGKTLQPDSLEEFALISNLIDLALTLPNQTIRIQWKGSINKAELFITLPGGMELTLELNVNNIQAEHDTLRTKLFEALDSRLDEIAGESGQYLLHTKLLDVLNTVGKNDPRRAQILGILDKNDKESLRTELEKLPGTDFLRTKLAGILGEQFAEIEPFLSQTLSFEWDENHNAVLKIPELGITGRASIFIPQNVEPVKDKKSVKLHPQIKEALSALLSQDPKSISSDEIAKLNNFIDLLLTLSNQDIHINWLGEANEANLIVTLPGGMTLRLEMDMKKIGESDILRTKLTELLGSQFAAEIEPLLSQTFTFNWTGETKEFSLKFLEKQPRLNFKSLETKEEVKGFFNNIAKRFINWVARTRFILLPQEIHGKVNLENGSVEFNKGTTLIVNTLFGITKRISLRLVSFARDNFIDIRLRCFGTQDIPIPKPSNDPVRQTMLTDERLVHNHQ